MRAFTTGDAARAGVSRSLGSCRSGGSLVVEVSDSRAVGELVVVRRVPARGGSLPVDLVASAVVGAREGAPVLVVVVHSDAAVARVSATATGGGADATTPAGGWSVLTEPLPAGPASPVVPAEVVATATSGRALAAVRIPGEPAVALPAACRASGTGPSGTGPSGTGPSGTGPSGTGPPASLPGAGAGPG